MENEIILGDYELLLADRLRVIKDVNKKYGLEDSHSITVERGEIRVSASLPIMAFSK